MRGPHNARGERMKNTYTQMDTLVFEEQSISVQDGNGICVQRLCSFS